MTARSDRRVRLVTVVVGVAGILLTTAPAAAQDISVNFGQGNGLTERVVQMIALLTVLSLAPSILAASKHSWSSPVMAARYSTLPNPTHFQM